MVEKTLILVGSQSDLTIVAEGTTLLKDLEIPFNLRIVSPNRSAQYLQGIIDEFEQAGGNLYICVSVKAPLLAGMVASLTGKPVMAVSVPGVVVEITTPAVPNGMPVANMGLGSAGFANACLFAAQISALSDPDLALRLSGDKKAKLERVVSRKDDLRDDEPGYN